MLRNAPLWGKGNLGGVQDMRENVPQRKMCKKGISNCCQQSRRLLKRGTNTTETSRHEILCSQANHKQCMCAGVRVRIVLLLVALTAERQHTQDRLDLRAPSAPEATKIQKRTPCLQAAATAMMPDLHAPQLCIALRFLIWALPLEQFNLTPANRRSPERHKIAAYQLPPQQAGRGNFSHQIFNFSKRFLGVSNRSLLCCCLCWKRQGMSSSRQHNSCSHDNLRWPYQSHSTSTEGLRLRGTHRRCAWHGKINDSRLGADRHDEKLAKVCAVPCTNFK